MLKKELKEKLTLLKKPLEAFLTDLNYNPKHLKRYKDADVIPNIFFYAVENLEKDIMINELKVALDYHKKIISLNVKKGKQILNQGSLAYFWDKNSQSIFLAPFEKKEYGLYYPKGRVYKGYHFAEKFTGAIPEKFNVKYFSFKTQVLKKVGLS